VLPVGAERGGSACRAESELGGSLDGCFLGVGVLGQSQVIGRSVVDSVGDVVIVVLGQHFGGWPREHSPVVEPELIFDEAVKISHTFHVPIK
jgi:hypothetical protein